MSRIDADTDQIIRLQLRKPRNWNWELSTKNTPSNIPLPIIQLYDKKKNLLVETKPFDRKSWNGDLQNKNESNIRKTNSYTQKHNLYNQNDTKLPHRTKSDASSIINEQKLPQRAKSYTQNGKYGATSDIIDQNVPKTHQKTYKRTSSDILNKNYDIFTRNAQIPQRVKSYTQNGKYCTISSQNDSQSVLASDSLYNSDEFRSRNEQRRTKSYTQNDKLGATSDLIKQNDLRTQLRTYKRTQSDILNINDDILSQNEQKISQKSQYYTQNGKLSSQNDSQKLIANDSLYINDEFLPKNQQKMPQRAKSFTQNPKFGARSDFNEQNDFTTQQKAYKRTQSDILSKNGDFLSRNEQKIPQNYTQNGKFYTLNEQNGYLKSRSASGSNILNKINDINAEIRTQNEKLYPKSEIKDPQISSDILNKNDINKNAQKISETAENCTQNCKIDLKSESNDPEKSDCVPRIDNINKKGDEFDPKRDLNDEKLNKNDVLKKNEQNIPQRSKSYTQNVNLICNDQNSANTGRMNKNYLLPTRNEQRIPQRATSYIQNGKLYTPNILKMSRSTKSTENNKLNFNDVKIPLYTERDKINTNDRIRIKECILKKSKSDLSNKQPNYIYRNSSVNTSDIYPENTCKYFLRSSNAGTLLVKEESITETAKKRRRRCRSDLRNILSSSDEENDLATRKYVNKKKSSSSCQTRVSSSSVGHSSQGGSEKPCKQKSVSFSDARVLKKDVNDSKCKIEDKLSDNKSDVYKKRKGTVIMGANFSRHSSKGMSGRRCQSISNICNSKDHYMDPANREIDAAYKFCNSLPSPNGTACNNNHEHKPVAKKTSLPNREQVIGSGHPHSECRPLQWKFTETQNLCDQGYGSERSPEEELPPLLSSHGSKEENMSDVCESPYPFITAENTFEVELVKGSRGLGLSVCGGVDSDSSWPGLLRIKRLFPHQPAATSGFLQVGDLILEANGVSVSGLSNCEALEVLRMTPNKVILLVCRPPPDVLSTMSPISDIPPPPPRRSSSPSHAAMKLTDDGYDTKFEITLMKVQGSLGFTLCKEEVGIRGHYVRALVREPAISDGRIQPGDKILEVNNTDISSMTHEEAVQFLRQCDKAVHLKLFREADRTPITDLSPTETTPNSSFRPKANLRQEAVDMLTDLAARKLCSDSPCTSPRHGGRDVTDAAVQYFDPDDDKAVRPCFLELYNPNQTPVAVRKSKFNLSLAHNAYELNNLDPEMLDAPNLNCAAHGDDIDLQDDYDYPEEPVSMPHLSCSKVGNFSHKKPTYQSAHQVESNSNSVKSSVITFVPEKVTKGEILNERESLVKWKGVVFSAERDLLDNDAQILNIELNRGWNSRLGFSLQEVDGCTCVSAVYPDSVAARDGRLRPGDCLLRVNDENVENMKTVDVIDLLRIIRGPVCITVLRRKLRLD